MESIYKIRKMLLKLEDSNKTEVELFKAIEKEFKKTIKQIKKENIKWQVYYCAELADVLSQNGIKAYGGETDDRFKDAFIQLENLNICEDFLRPDVE